MKRALSIFATSALFCFSAAYAGDITVTYDYTADAEAGGNTLPADETNDFPADPGIRTVAGGIDIDTQQPREFATIIGIGEDAPISFLGGAVAAGSNASASSQLIASITITNDTGALSEFFWNGLIFSGGVGFALPDFSSEACAFGAIASCGDFASPVGAFNFLPMLQQGDGGAALDFSGVVIREDGSVTSLFSEMINVAGDGSITETLTDGEGIALNGFGAAANNAAFLNWDDTTLTQSLGLLAAGESLTLQFIVNSAVFLDGTKECINTAPINDGFLGSCIAAFAGFGDPEEEGENGGWGIFANTFLRSVQISTISSQVVPLPGAAWLFGSVLLGGFGARRLKRKRSA
ncbi:MAG: hypothetical protein AAGD92_11865 [Pseudomonadota bacterium]